MAENEFRALMISRLDRLENQISARADRLENGQAELHGELRDLAGKVDRILEAVQGQAGSNGRFPVPRSLPAAMSRPRRSAARGEFGEEFEFGRLQGFEQAR